MRLGHVSLEGVSTVKFPCVGQLLRIRVFPRNTVMDTKIFTAIRKISSLCASSENSVEQ